MNYPNSQNGHPYGPYDNPGFQQDFISPNIYASPPPPYAPQFSAVPHYIPQVPTHQTIPAAPQTKHSVCCGSKKRMIVIVTAICVIVVAVIVAAVLAWYFVTSANCEMTCGWSSSCVRASKWCDGNYDCPNGEDEKYCVRLYGPGFQLQVYSPTKGQWIPVCSYGWDTRFGRATCQELGYSSSSFYESKATGSLYASSSFAVLNTSSPGSLLRRSVSESGICPTLTGVSLRCIDCGVRQSTSSSSRIVGGSVAQSGKWPWQAGLYSNGRFTCGGSIITSKWIVTAAHCVEGTNANAWVWKVYYGSIYKNQGSSSYVERVIAHPGYDTETKNNDIALMKLQSEITFSSTARPVCLPNDGMAWTSEDTCWISGWGATYTGGSSVETLREASVRLIDRTECNKPSVYNGAITSSMICAGYLSGGIDTCQGDSGGPLVTNTNSLWWLVGDTSWGTGCASRNKPGVYGNVTVFLSWIYQQMQTYK